MPTTWNNYIGQRVIPNLDGLRGIAIVMVLLHHCLASEPDQSHILYGVILNGRMGVAIFFVISGFLITSLFYRELRKYGKVHLAAFFVRRTARLMPLYYGVFALEAMFVFGLKAYAPENIDIFVRKIPSYLFYFSNWVAEAKQGPFFVAWSLAVEEQFYLIFAFLFAFARKAILPLLTLLLLVKVILMNLPGGDTLDSVMPGRVLLSYSEPILLGVALAIFLENASAFQRLIPFLANRGLQLLCTVAIVAVLVGFPLRETSHWFTQCFYLSTTFLIGALATGKGLAFLDKGLLPSVGRACYGIYLLHMPVFNLVKRFTDHSALIFLVGGLATYLLSLAVYRLFEAPFIRLGRDWSKKLISGDSAQPLSQQVT